MRIARFLVCLLLFGGLSAIPVQGRPQVALGVSVRFGPPVLPVYVQPVCPGAGFIWVPGYWAYGDDGYFWVPGTWVEPPEVGFLWTPGYWGFDDGFYIWHAGYWGPHVGFYGGIDYGFGYPGVGFYGGYWRGHDFFYNRAVTNINVEVIHNTYNARVFNNTNVTRVSFNGGPRGVQARATAAEMAVARERHVTMTSAQVHQRELASTNRALLASVNRGRPDIAATQRPGEFQRGGISRATNRAVNLNRPPESPRQSSRANSSRETNSRSFSDRPPSAQLGQSPHGNSALNQRQNQESHRIQQRPTQQRQMQQRPSQRTVRQPASNQRTISQVNQRRQPRVQPRQQPRDMQFQHAHYQPAPRMQQRPRFQQPRAMAQHAPRPAQRQAAGAPARRSGRSRDHA